MTFKTRLASGGVMTAIVAGIVVANALVLPSTAGAQFVFSVDDQRDASDAQPGDQECRSTFGTCTLRAAFEEINFWAADPACAGLNQIILPAGNYVLAAGKGPLAVGIGSGPDNGSCIHLEGTSANLGVSASVIDGNAGDGVDGSHGARQSRVLTIYEASHLLLKGVTIKRGHDHIAGGGILNFGALQIENTLITENWTHGRGGGIYNGGNITIFESTISKNRTRLNSGTLGGGGIANVGGDIFLIDVTISGNVAESSSHAGGILNTALQDSSGNIIRGGYLWMLNNTVAQNSSDRSSSGGIYNGTETSGMNVNDGSVIEFLNTIVARNFRTGSPTYDSNCTGTLNSLGYNLIGWKDYYCNITPAIGDQIGGEGAPAIDPLLGPLDDNGGPTPTHALRSGSPAIDQGSPDQPGSGGSACSDFDQRFVPRPKDGPLSATGTGFDGQARCDVGAYEYAAATASVADKSVTEGNVGTKNITFTISIPFFPPDPLNVSYATSPNTAKAGSDYQHTTGTVTFMPGELAKTVNVTVIGDKVKEGNETFFLDIRNATSHLDDNKVIIGKGRAVGTIRNDD